MPLKLESLVAWPRLTPEPPRDISLLAGEIVDGVSEAHPTQVLVRWQSIEGAISERRFSIVRGLHVAAGDRVLLQRPANSPEWIVTQAIGAAQPAETRVKRKRLVLEGADEVVLRCGSASLTLRRNGRVVLRGDYVESRSKGTNRIKGGSVLIN